MFKLPSRLILLCASLTWIFVGIFLLSLGIKLILATDSADSVLLALQQQFHFSKDNLFILLFSLALFIGYLKGRFVLKKTATRQIKRLLALPSPQPLSILYTKKYLLLIAIMMALGMALRFSPIPSEIRGFIDLIIGSALIQGATHYFPVIRNLKHEQ